MSNLKDWKRDPDKSALHVEGVYPGEFQPQAIGKVRGMSRLYFSWCYPCRTPEQAKEGAMWYVARNYGALHMEFYSNPQLIAQHKFYVLFVREDK